MIDKNVLTVDDIKNYLRIGRNAAYSLVMSEGFPVIRIGKTIRIHRDAFLRWLESYEKTRH
jgi:excisionase family DNA binding protein